MPVVVAQLVERLLPHPEVYCSNPAISKIYFEHLFCVNWMEKTKVKTKEAGNGPLKNDNGNLILQALSDK